MRKNLFCFDYKGMPTQSVGLFHGETVYFHAKLTSDFQSVRTGIIPGCRITIEMRKADREFTIFNFEDDDYYIRIDSCGLYMPVQTLSDTCYSAFLKTIEQRPAKYYLRRTQVIYRKIHLTKLRNIKKYCCRWSHTPFRQELDLTKVMFCFQAELSHTDLLSAL